MQQARPPLKSEGVRAERDIVLFSGASASPRRLDVDAGREMPVAFLSRAAAANWARQRRSRWRLVTWKRRRRSEKEL